MDTLILTNAVLFLSTLSLRRATRLWIMLYSGPGNFYPRSPCGERRLPQSYQSRAEIFLSTLSLRRATTPARILSRLSEISIHALLAESDLIPVMARLLEHLFLSTLSLRRATARGELYADLNTISIHALLAESDIMGCSGDADTRDFYPRSPCGERPSRYG